MTIIGYLPSLEQSRFFYRMSLIQTSLYHCPLRMNSSLPNFIEPSLILVSFTKASKYFPLFEKIVLITLPVIVSNISKYNQSKLFVLDHNSRIRFDFLAIQFYPFSNQVLKSHRHQTCLDLKNFVIYD